MLLKPLFQAWVDASERLGWHAQPAPAPVPVSARQSLVHRVVAAASGTNSSSSVSGAPVSGGVPSAPNNAATGSLALQLYTNVDNYINANVAQWEAMEASGRVFVIPRRITINDATGGMYTGLGGVSGGGAVGGGAPDGSPPFPSAGYPTGYTFAGAGTASFGSSAASVSTTRLDGPSTRLEGLVSHSAGSVAPGTIVEGAEGEEDADASNNELSVPPQQQQQRQSRPQLQQLPQQQQQQQPVARNMAAPLLAAVSGGVGSSSPPLATGIAVNRVGHHHGHADRK